MRVRSAVRSMRPYVPGASRESVQREPGDGDPIKLNQNENPLGPSPRAVAAAISALRDAHFYPDGSSPALRAALADLWDLPESWFLVGNGSDEVFRLLAEVYLEEGDAVVVPTPSFAGYPLVAELMGAELIRVPLSGAGMDVAEMARRAEDERAALMFLCRPNNPTGGVFAEAVLREAMEVIPSGTLVVVDEAYREFDDTPFDSRSLVLDYPNVVVTRTFSKLYGMAGFRLGYGIARPEVLEPLYRARDPFSVNFPAAAAGIAALGDREHVERTLALVREGREQVYDALTRLGLSFIPSQANFVLIDVERPAREISDVLMRRGVLVRPCTSFGLPTSIRVTVGTEREIAAFLSALERVLGAVSAAE